MKTNLKTFPEAYFGTQAEFEVWRRDFEAELREIIAGKQQPEYAFAKGMCKEILGE